MDNWNQSRRNFLKKMGCLTTGSQLVNLPVGLFVRSVLGGAFFQSWAHALGVSPRRYVNIQQFGAPPRWVFDLMLNAYGSTDSVNLGNSHLGTRYVASGGRYTDVVYETTLIKGIRVPSIWRNSVPAPNGATRPMSDLLENLLILQGMDTGNPGHAGSAALHFRPTGSTQSLGALSADQAKTAIPAVNTGAASFVFVSLIGKSPVTVLPSSKMLQDLLAPFLSQASANFKSTRSSANLKPVLNEVKLALGSMAQSDHLGLTSLLDSQKNAEMLIGDGFPDLAKQWDALYGKYKDLVDRSLKIILPGINDMPIGSSVVTSRNGTYANGENNIVKFSDLRELTATANVTISKLAENFALTEYILKNDLSYSITISPGSLVNLKVASGVNDLDRHGVDEHTTGKMISLYYNSLSTIAYSACLLELITVLKNSNKWRDTLLDVGGEFNRSARVNGFGSDHGYQGKSVALYSGAFKGPLVLGNITATPGPDAWGKGAPVTELKRQLHLGDMAATIAHLLRVPSPITSATTLVTLDENSQKLTPRIEKSRRLG